LPNQKATKRNKSRHGGTNPLRERQSLDKYSAAIGTRRKGLVLPDFDSEGHLRGRLKQDGTPDDEGHVGFQQLKFTTYTPENRPESED